MAQKLKKSRLESDRIASHRARARAREQHTFPLETTRFEPFTSASASVCAVSQSAQTHKHSQRTQNERANKIGRRFKVTKFQFLAGLRDSKAPEAASTANQTAIIMLARFLSSALLRFRSAPSARNPLLFGAIRLQACNGRLQTNNAVGFTSARATHKRARQ